VTTDERYACTVCDRADLLLTVNRRVRSHTADGKRRTPDNPNCDGGSEYPRGPEDKIRCHCGEWWKTIEAANAYGHNTGACPGDQCPGCGHAAHTGVCRELTMPGAPGDVDECGCLDDRETPAAPRQAAPVPAGAPALTVPGDSIMDTPRRPQTDTDGADALMAEDRPTDGLHKLINGNGRYVLPDPVTGAHRSWTRATTMAETISDLYSLNLWRLQMATIGFANHPELLAPFKGMVREDRVARRDELNRAHFRAAALAGAKDPAQWGTEMHLWIERLSRDEITLDDVEEKYRAEVSAWAAAMAEHGLSAVPHLIERRVAVPTYGTAGTLDQIDRVHRSRSVRLGNRIVRLNSGDHIVGDAKSGRSLEHGWGEIAIQMAIYAHGAREGRVARWDPDADSGDPEDPGMWVWDDIGIPPKSIRQDIGVVMHMPVGEKTCTLEWIDLEAGWSALALCDQVRDWRRVKGLHQPFAIAEVPTGPVAPPVVRLPTWEERFAAVTSRAAASDLYKQYRAAQGGGRPGPEADRLVKIARDHLRGLEEPSA